ncbi:hypothetical protein JMUB7557_27700 [Staphylococcus aureus]
MSRGLGDVYKRQVVFNICSMISYYFCLLYTSDAADDGESVDLGGRRIIKKNNAVSYTHLTLPTTERV